MNNNKVELFLDSGAFSAKSQGVEISLKEYISFIKENASVIDVYANLDVIGNPDASLKNLHLMEKAGLQPLPVYHFGEDPDIYLKPLIDKYDYVCIGGMVKAGNIISFLDRCFHDYICDHTGLPKVKVHGFGLTSLSLMLRYPWFSVDSTSWVVTGRMGGIFIPRWADNRWIYDGNSWKIAVSNMSPNIKEAGQHLETLSPINKKIVLRYIEEKGYCMGESKFVEVPQDHELADNEKWAEKKPLDKKAKRKLEIIIVPGISNRYQLRDEMNIIYFLDLEKSMPEWPWVFKLESRNANMF